MRELTLDQKEKDGIDNTKNINSMQSFPAKILTGRNRVVVIGLDSDAGNPGSNPVCDTNYRSVQVCV